MIKKLFCFALIICLFLVSCVTNSKQMDLSFYQDNYAMAEEFFSLKKYDKAAYYYDRCLTDPNLENQKNVKYKLARTYLFLEKWKEAIKIYDDLLLLDSENENLFLLKAYALIKQSEFTQAEDLYVKILEKYPNEQSAYKNLILLYILKKDFEKSDSLISKYKESFPLDDSISNVEKELEKQKKDSITDKENQSIEENIKETPQENDTIDNSENTNTEQEKNSDVDNKEIIENTITKEN